MFLIVFMLFSTSLITGCQEDNANNDTTQTQELTKEDKVRNAVRGRILSYSLIAKIGGNEIRSATQTMHSQLFLPMQQDSAVELSTFHLR